MRVAIVTNIPAPYRIPAWNLVAGQLGPEFRVFFCARIEPNRSWNIPGMQFDHIFLKENFKNKQAGGTVVHNNKDVWKQLNDYKPDVVITGGFNPTMLYAFAWCRLRNKKHIPMSDAWEKSEMHLSKVHHLLRKIIFRFSRAFISCSIKGKLYYQKFGVKKEKVFISHYTITNSAFENTNALADRRWDIMFSGQFIERKNPAFFVEIAKRLKDIKVLLLGDGPLKEELLAMLQQSGIEYTYPGFVNQQDLAQYYSQSKIFLFPTGYDAWGVVAHEALAAGTPVITTPNAGCSDELVLHDQNGFVLPLELDAWVQQCKNLLNNPEKWERFSTNAKETAAAFSHQRAANALIEACKFADQQGRTAS